MKLLDDVSKTVHEITESINQAIDQGKGEWMEMNQEEVMKEYQKKLEGIYKGDYTVSTPLLQTYDRINPSFDAINMRIEAVEHMKFKESSIPSEKLESVSKQLETIVSNASPEKQISYLENEGRQLDLSDSVVIQKKTSSRTKQMSQSLERGL